MIEALVISQVLSWLALVGLVIVLFALARQIGVLHERIAPLGARMMDHGAAVGESAPVLDVKDRHGEAIRLGDVRPDGRSTLLLFVASICPMCKKLLPAARSFAQSERRRLELILVGDGDRAEQERYVREQNLEQVTFVNSPVVGMTYQVGKLPYAVLIDAQGIIRAKGLVNSREHLESLLVAQETGFASLQEYAEAHASSA